MIFVVDDLIDLEVAKNQRDMDVINFCERGSCVNIRSDFKEILNDENIKNDIHL